MLFCLKTERTEGRLMLKEALTVGEMMKTWVKGTWQSDVSLNSVVKGMGSRTQEGALALDQRGIAFPTRIQLEKENQELRRHSHLMRSVF